MPTKREREYYRMGFRDGERSARGPAPHAPLYIEGTRVGDVFKEPKRKRKLSAWNKFVKANSNKPRFRYARSNKINLKKMAIAFRKTPAGRKKRR
jgi:hypothetical protein